MASLPELKDDSPTVKAIYASYVAKNEPRYSRRLGASVIGKACHRAIWYDFRWAGQEKFSGRMLRLFDTGHLSEYRFAKDLEAIGCEVMSFDPDSKQQWEFIAIDGHFVDKLDGVLIGLPEASKTYHVCEFKTHSSKSFADLKKKGLNESKPQHYAQLMVGMHLAELERGFYLAVNKDNDELYSERIKYDKVEAEHLIELARRIVTISQAPERISNDRDSFACKFCSHNTRCHGPSMMEAGVPVTVSCRSCVHATAVTDSGTELGIWRCEKHDRTLDEIAQLAACDDHLLLPDFITFAEPQDSGHDPDGDWIEYANLDGSKWRNGKQPGMYRSIELTLIPSPLIGADNGPNVLIDSIKKNLAE